MSTRRSLLSVVVLVAAAALAACGGRGIPESTDNPPAEVTADVSTTAASAPQSTSTLPPTSPTTAADLGIRVSLRLPGDWKAATVWVTSDTYPDVDLQMEATGSTLDVALPGAGLYMFWAETPSSADGQCHYQAQSHPQWEDISVQDGESVVLAQSGELCY